MKKIFLGIIVILFLTLYGIAENHQRVQKQWGEWKEQTLDGAHPEKPGFCLYCYIRDKFRKDGRDINDVYSEKREPPFLYYVDGCGYATFERYMWDVGFPDTIIVKFTRDGKFMFYADAVRSGLLEDSTGIYYSPSYIFRDAVGHSWVYDIKGKFVEFNESPYPHSTQNEEEPYNP